MSIEREPVEREQSYYRRKTVCLFRDDGHTYELNPERVDSDERRQPIRIVVRRDDGEQLKLPVGMSINVQLPNRPGEIFAVEAIEDWDDLELLAFAKIGEQPSEAVDSLLSETARK